MRQDDRLDFFDNPVVPIPDDTGDHPILIDNSIFARRGRKRPEEIVTAQMAPSVVREGRPLPNSDSFFPIPRFATLGRIDVSDVISPYRFRRVYQTINIRRNDSYKGSIYVVFQTHVGAMIAEELGAAAPTAPRAPQAPTRRSTYTTAPSGQISGHTRRRESPPQRGTDREKGISSLVDKDVADRFENWNQAGSGVGQAIDIENINDSRQGEDTDNAIQTLGEIIRPRSWIRHTVLSIRFKYPLMEAEGFGRSWMVDPKPHGDTPWEMERNSALQHTIKTFAMFAGSSYGIEIPYPVGSRIPIHFDILNLNPIYSANVNLSILVNVERQE